MKQSLVAMLFASTILTVQAQTQPSPLNLSGLRVTQEQSISTIAGTATNNAAYPLTQAFITFNLYDQSGAIVGNTMTYVQNLAPGGQWRFAAQTPLAFVRVQVSEIQVFPPTAPSR